MAEDNYKKFQGQILVGDRKSGQEDISSSKKNISTAKIKGSAPTSGKPAGDMMQPSIKGYKK
jgi:hypothetical protein